MMRTSRLLPLSLGLLLLLGLGWFGYLRTRASTLDRMLMIAVSRRDLRKAAELLDQGANPNAADRNSGSALAWTVHTKNPEMCKLLLERGADPTNARSFSRQPLFSAVVSLGDPEIVKAFLEKGANPRPVSGQNIFPLRGAAQLGHVKVMELLLDAGAPVDEGRRTALMEATEFDRDAAAKFLISRGAEVDRAEKMETPLLRACRMRKWKAAKVLIEAGAEVTFRDRNRWTPLHWAARRQHLPTMQLLVSKGAEVDARDGNGHTSLMYAAMYGNPGVARWLLAHGADPSLRDPRKVSALDFARQYKRADVVALLQGATGERELARRVD